jgi:hypothetical protein
VTGLHAEVGAGGSISSLTEIEEFFRTIPNYLSYRGAAFNVESPTRIGLGNNFISLVGGIAVAFSKDANLYIAGGYGVHGTGERPAIWHEKHKVRSGSASEAQGLSSIFKGLHSNLRKAIKVFAEELSQRGPI